ncbi:MAG: hypothetical protein Q8909_05615 [Bacteroidota bacterium]|uniref:hypothetical protein n=1 Tax=Parabacteroides sp. FAFU027 TaxID=2922715 RepID=UPI001FAEF38A|nr:hypothetical protein [Parabacteroides sp. FAFU027]MDP4269586.1 hypothetical protein [Bacteroidota bacterium]
MKKSNKILILLAIIAGVAYFSNMGYHIYKLRKVYQDKDMKALFNNWTQYINVVCVTNPDSMILTKFRVEQGINYFRINTDQQEKDFYKNMATREDTLFVSAETAYILNRRNNQQEYYIGLPNVKQLYWNGKLVQSF